MTHAEGRRQTANGKRRPDPNSRPPPTVRRQFSIASILLLLCVPALVPMLGVTFWQSHDGLHHVFRLANFDETLRSGVLVPRWADQLGFGYGFPVTHYYAPLAYYLADIFHLGGMGYLDSIKLTYALGIVASAFGMYFLARVWLSRVAALLAAAAYVYYPYHLADIYMRGTLTEFIALSLLPLVAWAAVRLAKRPTADVPSPLSNVQRLRGILVFALLLAALILTHNLTAFLFLPVLMLLLLLAFGGRGSARSEIGRRSPRARWGWLLDCGLGTLLAFAFTAFYWLPALSEVAWIRAGQVSGSAGDVSELLTPLTQFVAPLFTQPYVPDAPASLQHPLNALVAIVALVSMALTLWQRARFSTAQWRAWLAWLVIALLTTLAMVDLSAPLWTAIRVLSFVQFPYRLHALLGLALALLIGYGGEVIGSWQTDHATRGAQHAARITKHASAISAVVISVLLMFGSLGSLRLLPQSLPGHSEPISESQVNVSGMSEYDYQTALWARLYGGVWLLEYLPAWVTQAREDFFLPTAQPVANRTLEAEQVAVEQYRPQQRVLRVKSAAAFTLSFHTFYFPAWQVRVDDQPVRTFPSGSLGLVTADIPPGEHRVALSFEGTPLQHAGEWASVIALGAVVLVVLLRGQHRKLWLSSLLLVLTGVLGWRSFNVRMMDGPQTIHAAFADQIDLLGYQIEHSQYRAGEVVNVTLYWFARQTPAENFKVFVHVDGANGRVGQVDMQPGLNFSPTTRWQRGEVIADHYRVRIAANAASGAYDLYTGIYRAQPLQNLSVVSANAVPGDRVRLGTVTIVSP